MKDHPQRTRPPRDDEATLDRRIRSLLGTGRPDYSPEEWRGLREQLRLALLYPGRYVAFRDHYSGEGVSLRLVRREVLLASRSLTALNRRLAKLPEHTRQGAHVVFVEPEQAP
jgi:hypothetical protein